MNTKKVVLASMGIVINIIFGSMVAAIKIPLLFLDTIGTIFTGVILGPFYGALTGGLTNLIQGVMTNPKNIPFALVNIAVGIIVGLVARRFKFDFKTALFTGIILAVVAPLIGTPIAVYIYGGLTGGGTDLIFAWLAKSGQKIFTAAFIPRITGNIVDKIASCLLVATLIAKLPKDLMKEVSN